MSEATQPRPPPPRVELIEGDALKTSILTCKNPGQFLTDFEAGHRMRLPAASDPAAASSLDALLVLASAFGLPREQLYRSSGQILLARLKAELSNAANSANHVSLLILCLPYLSVPALMEIPRLLLARAAFDVVHNRFAHPSSFFELLSKCPPEQQDRIPICLLRRAWELYPQSFAPVVDRLARDYVTGDLEGGWRVGSTALIAKKVLDTAKRRRLDVPSLLTLEKDYELDPSNEVFAKKRSNFLQDVLRCVGPSTTLYRAAADRIRVLFQSTKDARYCTLQADVVLGLSLSDHRPLADAPPNPTLEAFKSAAHREPLYDFCVLLERLQRLLAAGSQSRQKAKEFLDKVSHQVGLMYDFVEQAKKGSEPSGASLAHSRANSRLSMDGGAPHHRPPMSPSPSLKIPRLKVTAIKDPEFVKSVAAVNKLGLKIVSALTNEKEALNPKEKRWKFFIDPIAKTTLPEFFAFYSTIVKRPMDLHTIKERCSKDFYFSLLDLQRDLELIASNTLLFHEKPDVPSNEYATKAKELLPRIAALLAEHGPAESLATVTAPQAVRVRVNKVILDLVYSLGGMPESTAFRFDFGPHSTKLSLQTLQARAASVEYASLSHFERDLEVLARDWSEAAAVESARVVEAARKRLSEDPRLFDEVRAVDSLSSLPPAASEDAKMEVEPAPAAPEEPSPKRAKLTESADAPPPPPLEVPKHPPITPRLVDAAMILAEPQTQHILAKAVVDLLAVLPYVSADPASMIPRNVPVLQRLLKLHRVGLLAHDLSCALYDDAAGRHDRLAVAAVFDPLAVTASIQTELSVVLPILTTAFLSKEESFDEVAWSELVAGFEESTVAKELVARRLLLLFSTKSWGTIELYLRREFGRKGLYTIPGFCAGIVEEMTEFSSASFVTMVVETLLIPFVRNSSDRTDLQFEAHKWFARFVAGKNVAASLELRPMVPGWIHEAFAASVGAENEQSLKEFVYAEGFRQANKFYAGLFHEEWCVEERTKAPPTSLWKTSKVLGVLASLKRALPSGSPDASSPFGSPPMQGSASATPGSATTPFSPASGQQHRSSSTAGLAYKRPAAGTPLYGSASPSSPYGSVPPRLPSAQSPWSPTSSAPYEGSPSPGISEPQQGSPLSEYSRVPTERDPSNLGSPHSHYSHSDVGR